MRKSVGHRGSVKVKISTLIDNGLFSVDYQIVVRQGGDKIFSGNWKEGRKDIRKDKRGVINDSCKNKSRVSSFKGAKDKRQCDDKEERAAGVALRNAFPQCVLNCIGWVKEALRVARKGDSGGFMKEKAKP
jgi:hypothetical protein